MFVKEVREGGEVEVEVEVEGEQLKNNDWNGWGKGKNLLATFQLNRL